MKKPTGPRDAERWQRIEDLFFSSVDLEPEARGKLLDDRCGADRELRREVDALLVADSSAATFLAKPVAENALAGAFDDTLVEGKNRKLTREYRDTLPAGSRLGPYRIVEEIGCGGSAVVYLAERDDEVYQQKVAVKVLQAGIVAQRLGQRFRQERQILAGLDHPNIAQLLDGGTAFSGSPYLVMELIEGKPIDTYCEEQGLTFAERLKLFLNVLSAVHYAHQSLVVHRDIKPNNILVRNDQTPKLLDFGIAKLLDPAMAGQIDPTRADMLLLTPNYASPEQISGGPITTSTDIYSLGIVLYKMLSGTAPYKLSSNSLHDIVTAVCEQQPIPPSAAALASGQPELARQLRGDLDHIVSKAMAKEPADRYQSAERFADDVHNYLESRPVSARPPMAHYRAGRFIRRNRMAVTLVTTATMILTFLVGGIVLQSTRARRAVAVAENQIAAASATRTFLQELLASAHPVHGKGHDVTVLEAIQQAEGSIATTFVDHPAIESAVLGVIADTYREMGRLDEAERLHLRSLKLIRSLPGQRAELAEILEDLGKLYRVQGRIDEAEAYYSEAIEMIDEEYGPNHERTLLLMVNLGTLFRTQGRLDEAERNFRTAREVFLSEDRERWDWFAASTLQNLAIIQGMRGLYLEAAESFGQAVREYRRLGPRGEGGLPPTLHNLGFVQIITGDYEGAKVTFEESVEIGLRHSGEHSSDVVMAQIGIAEALAGRGEFEPARHRLEAAATEYLTIYGDQHANVADILNTLTGVHLALGDLGSADKVATQARAILLANQNPDRLEIADSHQAMAKVLVAKAQYEEALSEAQKAVDILSEEFDHNHHDTAVAESLKTSILVRLGRAEEALSDSEHALRILQGTCRTTARQLVNAHLTYITCLMQAGRIDEARRELNLVRSSWPNYAIATDPLSIARAEIERQLGAN